MAHDRRRRERKSDIFTLSLAPDLDPQELEGLTVNHSTHGLLVRVRGRIGLRVKVKGKLHYGSLVRASTTDGMTECAIQLDEPLGR